MSATPADPGLADTRPSTGLLTGPLSGAVGLLAVLAVLLSALYWGVVRDMVRQWWTDPNYTHGFLVPVLSGLAVWRRRAELPALATGGNVLGLPVLAAGLGMLVLGNLAAELFLMRSSLLVVLTGLVLFHLGGGVLRALLFPLGFLLFMIPLPATIFYAITFPLQRVAAVAAAGTLELLNVPVMLEGNIIRLSQITLGVTEACSGIRSLISLLGGAVGWAYLMLPGRVAQTVFVASAVPITIVANSGRIVATGLIGRTFGIEYASGFFHGFSGWAVYVIALVALAATHRALTAIAAARHRRRGA